MEHRVWLEAAREQACRDEAQAPRHEVDGDHVQDQVRSSREGSQRTLSQGVGDGGGGVEPLLPAREGVPPGRLDYGWARYGQGHLAPPGQEERLGQRLGLGVEVRPAPGAGALAGRGLDALAHEALPLGPEEALAGREVVGQPDSSPGGLGQGLEARGLALIAGFLVGPSQEGV